MTINPPTTTTPIGELGPKGVDRPASGEPRRTRAAAPPSEVARDDADEPVAAVAAEKEAESRAAAVLEFPLQELSIRRDPPHAGYPRKATSTRAAPASASTAC